MVAYPLTLLDICVMSDGAAVCILADRDTAFSLTDRPVKISGVGTGTDAMRMSDRPRGEGPWWMEDQREQDVYYTGQNR